MKKKNENILINLLFNIVLPVLILTKFSGENYLGPVYGLIIALVFPLSYGIYDFIISKNINFVSVLGFTSVMLTGVFGLFQLDPLWIAIKEASVPLLIALIIIFSMNSKFSLVSTLIYNEAVFDTKKIDERLTEINAKDSFYNMLKKTSWWLAASFILSSILNFSLARYILTADPGTVQYNEQLGKMQALSFPVIAIPCTIFMLVILFYLVKSLKKITGFSFEEMTNAPKKL